MASIFGHALTAYAFSKGFSKELVTPKFWILGIICAVLPDADVIGFAYHIPYESFWGHRGFSHSLLFAISIGLAITVLFYRTALLTKKGWNFIAYFSICTASHGIFDALTTGGLGVAFFSPFDTTRYFFPWRPIKVSPIGVSNFFSIRGARILFNEFLWIGIPSGLLIFLLKTIKKR